MLVGLHGVDGIKAYTTSMSALSIVLRDANGHSAGLEQVGQEIVKVLRSTGLTTEEVNAQFATTVDTLVALKTQFGVAIPEVTTLAKYWSSYAASIGMSTTQIWAWSAALVSVVARAQGAGGALTKILEKATAAAAEWGKDWAKWAQVLGISTEAAKELLKQDPNGFLTRFAQGMSNSSKAGAVPFFEACETGGFRRIRFTGQLFPLCSSPQHPEHTFQQYAVVPPGTTALGLPLRRTQEGRQRRPVLILQLHPLRMPDPSPCHRDHVLDDL
ncbi:phage tail tape measure protein [Deinococcus irradiatisoli]|uniref:Phage tail tape measure protein n=1 Tax=Deinococcus irradiatisoli TaxID=2202254 RepID=A0A2Z3JM66_9DEIO|nr:phage tail tape measure protein [Deinococcus irradiatisoli]